MTSKALVSLSGGMDSATILGQVLQLRTPDLVETVGFSYGSKHNSMENLAAQKLADHYKVQHTLIDLPFIKDLFRSDLLLSGGEIPEGHYADPTMKKTVVPFRNGIMLSVLVGYAESIDANVIYLGNHAGDHAIYPDCRSEFIDAMSQAILNGTYNRVELRSLFCNISKADIVRIGTGIHVPYELTYSCYKGGHLHCGKCGTCYERREAFMLSGINDPTVYLDC